MSKNERQENGSGILHDFANTSVSGMPASRGKWERKYRQKFFPTFFSTASVWLLLPGEHGVPGQRCLNAGLAVADHWQDRWPRVLTHESDPESVGRRCNVGGALCRRAPRWVDHIPGERVRSEGLCFSGLFFRPSPSTLLLVSVCDCSVLHFYFRSKTTSPDVLFMCVVYPFNQGLRL